MISGGGAATTKHTAQVRRERTVSSDGTFGGRSTCAERGQQQPATVAPFATKSILKSSAETVVTVADPADISTVSSSSSSRLLRAAAHPSHIRQHSMDAAMPNTPSGGGAGRAVTFFLESENSEFSFPDRPDPLLMVDNRPSLRHQSPASSSSSHHHQHRSPRHFSPKLQQQQNNNGSAAFRRTSLPVPSNVSRQNLLLQSQVNSARGILMDLLATNRRDLSPNVAACLKAVTALLNPASPTGGQQAGCGYGTGESGRAGSLSLGDLGVPSIVESPYSGEVHIALVGFI